MAAWLAEARPDLSFPQTCGEASDIRIAHCPERVLPGHVLRELVQNDRVIGGMTPKCSALATSLYKIFVQGECIVTNARTAEMCKLTENSFRDVNIAFANELSNRLYDSFDVDVLGVDKARQSVRHPRVNILQPGPGVGGHCIAVDPWFIVSQAEGQARLIRTAREVNDSKPGWVMEKVNTAIAEHLSGNPGKLEKDVVIACFGLAFKPDIDDLRESPALEIAKDISKRHPGKVLVVEPNIEGLPEALKETTEITCVEEAIARADVLLLLVDHKEFKAVPAATLQGRKIVDTRGIWLP